MYLIHNHLLCILTFYFCRVFLYFFDFLQKSYYAKWKVGTGIKLYETFFFYYVVKERALQFRERARALYQNNERAPARPRQ